MIPATIVDTTAIAKILLAVLIVGVGVTAIFGQGAAAAERLREARRDGETTAVARNGAIVGVSALVCVAALAVGVVAMTHK
jgi:hypothetical protein